VVGKACFLSPPQGLCPCTRSEAKHLTGLPGARGTASSAGWSGDSPSGPCPCSPEKSGRTGLGHARVWDDPPSPPPWAPGSFTSVSSICT
jgi:hypothetical protein